MKSNLRFADFFPRPLPRSHHLFTNQATWQFYIRLSRLVYPRFSSGFQDMHLDFHFFPTLPNVHTRLAFRNSIISPIVWRS
jgi:hypothetical protein